MGTLIAWVLVRDHFRGQGLVNSLIDLPFALPTIVAGLTLLALYGPSSPVGHQHRLHRAPASCVALLLVTLPFVVRAVQPVLLELDREMEQAAASLGASRFTIFRRVIFPNLVPAVLGGSGLAFARALGEFGSLVLIAGNIPFDDPGLVALHLQPDRVRPARRRRAAVSVCLLVLSLAVARCSCPASSAGARAMPADDRARASAQRPRGRATACARSRSPTWLLLLVAPARARLLRTRSTTASARSGRPSRAREALHALWLTILITAIAVPLNTIFGVVGGARAGAPPGARADRSSAPSSTCPFALSPVVVGLCDPARLGPARLVRRSPRTTRASR